MFLGLDPRLANSNKAYARNLTSYTLPQQEAMTFARQAAQQASNQQLRTKLMAENYGQTYSDLVKSKQYGIKIMEAIDALGKAAEYAATVKKVLRTIDGLPDGAEKSALEAELVALGKRRGAPPIISQEVVNKLEEIIVRYIPSLQPEQLKIINSALEIIRDNVNTASDGTATLDRVFNVVSGKEVFNTKPSEPPKPTGEGVVESKAPPTPDTPPPRGRYDPIVSRGWEDARDGAPREDDVEPEEDPAITKITHANEKDSITVQDLLDRLDKLAANIYSFKTKTDWFDLQEATRLDHYVKRATHLKVMRLSKKLRTRILKSFDAFTKECHYVVYNEATYPASGDSKKEGKPLYSSGQRDVRPGKIKAQIDNFVRTLEIGIKNLREAGDPEEEVSLTPVPPPVMSVPARAESDIGVRSPPGVDVSGTTTIGVGNKFKTVSADEIGKAFEEGAPEVTAERPSTTVITDLREDELPVNAIDVNRLPVEVTDTGTSLDESKQEPPKPKPRTKIIPVRGKPAQSSAVGTSQPAAGEAPATAPAPKGSGYLNKELIAHELKSFLQSK
jgi:hypothetical protein